MEARGYVNAFLASRRGLQKDGPLGIQVGDRPGRRKRSVGYA